MKLSKRSTWSSEEIIHKQAIDAIIEKHSAIIDYPKGMYQKIVEWVSHAKRYWEDKQNRFDISDLAIKLEKEADNFFSNNEPETEYTTNIVSLIMEILSNNGAIFNILYGRYNNIKPPNEYDSYNESMRSGEFYITDNDENTIKGFFYIMFPLLYLGPLNVRIRRRPESEETFIHFEYNKNTQVLTIDTIDTEWMNKVKTKIYNTVQEILSNPRGGLYGHIEKTDEYADGSPHYSAQIPSLEEFWPEFKSVSMKMGEEAISGLLDFTKPLRKYQDLANNSWKLSNVLDKIEDHLSLYTEMNKNSPAPPLRFESRRQTDFGESLKKYFKVDLSDTEQYKKHTWMKGIEDVYDNLEVVIYQKRNPEAAGSHWDVYQRISLYGVAEHPIYNIKETIKHELVHMVQTMITRAIHVLKPETSKKRMGLPGPYRPDEYHKYDSTTTEEGLKLHALSDVEFFTRLVDMIEKMRDEVGGRYLRIEEYSRAKNKNFKDLTPQEQNKLFNNRLKMFIETDRTLRYFREHDQAKYQKALRELYRQFEQITKSALVNTNISKIAKDPLKKYKEKRDFEETSEPEGKAEKGKNKHRFVIQDHHASHHHWDLRIENDKGSMSSWALPKHKLPSGKERLLAQSVEDHPISYNKFEGEIPAGEYGAGTVKIHDSGTYTPIKWTSDTIKFKLSGKKEKGTYTLHKTDGKRWILMVGAEKEEK